MPMITLGSSRSKVEVKKRVAYKNQERFDFYPFKSLSIPIIFVVVANSSQKCGFTILLHLVDGYPQR